MERVELYWLMREQCYGLVSSIAIDGTPQSALVGIAATPELDLIFDTARSSRKYRNLVRDPRCFVVLGWSGGQTVQFEGIAEQPVGDALLRLRATYFEVWPEAPARMSWPGIAFFVVRPKSLRYSDYDRNSPFVWEFSTAG